MTELKFYADLLGDIKSRIREAQIKAGLSVNAEMILMYWDIGRMIHERQQKRGWGAGVIPRLAKDIRNELPEVKGFSERNIGYMIRFAREYEKPILQQAVAKLATGSKVPQPVAQMPDGNPLQNLQQLVAQIPWGHNIQLMEKVKDLPSRLWYMQQTIEQGWSRDVLGLPSRRLRQSCKANWGMKTMNPDWLLKHFEQTSETPDAVPRLRAVQIPQTPSGESQGSSPMSTSWHPFNISQTSSAKLAAAFPMKKRLMEWAEAALQSESGGR